MKNRRQRHSAFIFGEGGKEEKFYKKLFKTENFKYHIENKWFLKFDSSTGSSPRFVLEDCMKNIKSLDYDLILVFLDTDILKDRFGNNWEVERQKIEDEFKEIEIIWQDRDLEDEIRKVLKKDKTKHKLNKKAKENIDKFIGSDIAKKIKEKFKYKEKELN